MKSLQKRYQEAGVEEQVIREIRDLGVHGAWLKREDQPDLIAFTKYANRLVESGEITKVVNFTAHSNEDVEELIDIVLVKVIQKIIDQENRIKELHSQVEFYQKEKYARRERIRQNLIELAQKVEC